MLAAKHKEDYMLHYYIECDYCDAESQVSTEDKEPEYCPCCGHEINAQLLDAEDED